MIPTGSTIRRRMLLLLASITTLFFILIVQLFNLQVVGAQSLQERAQNQWTNMSVVIPRRGSILDRNGNALAVSATAYMVSVNPRQVKDAPALAKRMSEILEIDYDQTLKKASDTTKGGYTLKRQVPKATVEALRAELSVNKKTGNKTLDGLYFEEDSRRYYPMGSFLTQVLGLTTIDGEGQSGLEKTLDKYLAGKPGKVLNEVDGKGREIPYSASEYIPPVPGGDVTLTIDYVIQSFVEKAMRECASITKAKIVQSIVMDIKTGEILAMCIKPDYDPNNPPRDDVDMLKEMMGIKAITDVYEPGSTFKIITMSSVLEEGLARLSNTFYCTGSIMVDGKKIRCWSKPHGHETLMEALENSCNPVFVELGLRLGADRMYKYLDAFGLGRVTNIDIPGEGTGIVIPKSLVKRGDIARMGFGQSIAVTPIQLLTAISAAVNDGKRMKPYIIKQITSQMGEILVSNQPEQVAQAISPETSRIIRTMMESVAENGGSKNARISGYRIGGKTGTAQVYVNGIISTDTHIGSFVGIAPIDDPRIAVIVTVNDSKLRPDFGSITAIPFAKSIMENTLPYLGYQKVPVKGEPELKEVAVPDIYGLKLEDAIERLKEYNLGYLLAGSGGKVIDQLPAAGATVVEKSLVMLYVDGQADVDEDGMVQVPDVSGRSIVEANRLIKSYGLEMAIEGSGVATSQSPEPGTLIEPNSIVKVNFTPLS